MAYRVCFVHFTKKSLLCIGVLVSLFLKKTKAVLFLSFGQFDTKLQVSEIRTDRLILKNGSWVLALEENTKGVVVEN